MHPPQLVSHKGDFLSLLATSFSLLGGDNPGQIFSSGNSHAMGLALDLFFEINNKLRDVRRKFKSPLTIKFIQNDSVAKHCLSTEDISPTMPTTQREPLQLI